MFKARLTQGRLLKCLAEATKELVTDANWEITGRGISMQAMDTSHVCLVAFMLRAEGFAAFSCDRARVLGMSHKNLAAALKCAGNDDAVTLSAAAGDDADTLDLVFESPGGCAMAQYSARLLFCNKLIQRAIGAPLQQARGARWSSS
jgi:proliferating cell nuclear antigen